MRSNLDIEKQTKVEKTSVLQDDMKAFIFAANFENDFQSDYYNEF